MKNKKALNICIYIILGVLSLTMGILLLIPDIRKDILNILAAASLLLYILFFLLKQVLKERKFSFVILQVIEIVIVTIITIGLFIPALKLTDGLLIILGVILWIRGAVDFVELIFGTRTQKEKIIGVIVNLALVTTGTILMTNIGKNITNDVIAYILVALLFIVTTFSIIMLVQLFKKPKK